MIKLFESFINNLDLKKLKVGIDKFFKKYGFEIKFTKHFIERLNDERNEDEIIIDNLYNILIEIYENHLQDIKMFKDNYNAVIIDKSENINIPFVLRYNWENGNIELIFKSIFKKKNFKTSNNKYVVYTKKEKVLNEFLDEVNHDGIYLSFSDLDSAIFGYYNNKFIYEEDSAVHTYYGYGRSDYRWEYPGRLWKKSKIITFWVYPSWDKLKEIINKIENKSGMEIWNNGWKIEVIENYKYISDEIKDRSWENKDFGLILIPLERYKEYWKENKIIYSFPKKELDKEHIKSPLNKNKKFIKGFGSDFKKDKERGEWTFAKTKYMGEKLNESPDFVSFNDKLLKFYDKDSAIFGYLKNKFIYDESDNSEHRYYEYRGYWDYPGRLWKNEKVISFWTYPDSEDFEKIINEIENKSGMKLWNNNWKIEVISNFEEKEGDYGENFLKRKTEIIPIENYKLYWDKNTIKKSFSKEEIDKEHEKSPLLKKKRNLNKYFGSLSPKGKQPLSWKQAKLKSESKILKFNNFKK